MMKLNLSGFYKDTQELLVKRGPEILTGIGIAGMFTTVVLAVKATPKALSLIDAEVAEMDGFPQIQPDVKDLPRMLPFKDTVRITWKCYIPAVVTGGVSIACLVGASSVNIRRNAALATAYTLSESALKEYKAKVVETIGEKKEQAVREAIVKDKLEQNPVSRNEVFISKKGDTLCYDIHSGRYFKSDIDQLDKIENRLNKQMMNDMYISLNDLYYEVGLTGTPQGDDLGWSIEKGFIEFRYTTQLADDGTPCLVIEYNLAPRYNYR